MAERVQPVFTPEGLRRVRIVSGPAGSGRTTRLKMLLVDARRAGQAVAGFLAERDGRGRRRVTDVATGESRLLPAKPGPRREKALAFVRQTLANTDENAVVFLDETASGGAADERTARAGWDLLASGKYKSAVMVLSEPKKAFFPLPAALPGAGNGPKPPEPAGNAGKTPPVGWIPREKWGQPTEIHEIGQVPPPRGDVTKEKSEEAADERAKQARERWAEKLWEAGVKDEEAIASARQLLAKGPENGQKSPKTAQKTPETAKKSPILPQNPPESAENGEKTQENGEKTRNAAGNGPEGPSIPPDFLPGGGAKAEIVLKALSLLKTGDGREAKEALGAPDAQNCLASLGLGERDVLQPLPAKKPVAPAAPAEERDPYALPSPPGEPPRRFAS